MRNDLQKQWLFIKTFTVVWLVIFFPLLGYNLLTRSYLLYSFKYESLQPLYYDLFWLYGYASAWAAAIIVQIACIIDKKYSLT